MRFYFPTPYAKAQAVSPMVSLPTFSRLGGGAMRFWNQENPLYPPRSGE